MHLSRRNPRLRSFKNVIFAALAIFVLTNFVDSPFTRVFAPSAEASTIAAANAADYIPADVPTSGDHNLDLIIMRAGARALTRDSFTRSSGKSRSTRTTLSRTSARKA